MSFLDNIGYLVKYSKYYFTVFNQILFYNLLFDYYVE